MIQRVTNFYQTIQFQFQDQQKHLFLSFKQIYDYFSLIIQIKSMKKQQIWTNQEDQILASLYSEAGCFQRWKFITTKLKEKGILKTQFQCRERYINHLVPGLKVGKLEQSEIIKLFDCYDEYGPKWSFFQTKIRGRSQIMLKNQFYSTLRSLLRLLIKIGQQTNLYLEKFDTANYSSKLLTDIYEGRKGFCKQRNFFKNCLKNIGYCVEKQLLQNYLKIVDKDQMKSLLKTVNEQIQKKQAKKENEKQIGDKKEQEKREKRFKTQNNMIQKEQKKEREREDQFINKNPQITVKSETHEIINNFWEYNFYPMPSLATINDQYNVLGQEYVYSYYFYPC